MVDTAALLSPKSGSTIPGSAPSSAANAPLEERLSQLLSNPSFSVAAYLNLALASSGSNDTDILQSRMTELALHLQLQTQSCHEDIGRIGAELQAILPRCASDVGRIGLGLEGMKADAQVLLEQQTSVTGEEEQEVSSSLETLSTLHALQSNLARTKQVLTAAATWDSTLSSIPPLLAQQNLTQAVAALALLEEGERALQGMPHREDRQASIAKIRQQVQVLLQPQLTHALQHMSTRLAPLQQCVQLYDQLDQRQALQDEYVKLRPSSLHQAWFSFSPSYDPETGAAASEEFVAWLPQWYEKVLSTLTEERRQATTVFGAVAAPDMVVKVLRECFRPILPSFQSRLENLCSASPNLSSKGSSFESICATFESTLRFLSLAYELVAGNFLDLTEAGLTPKGDNGSALYQELVDVALQVASPFTNYQLRFSQLEGNHQSVATSSVSRDMQQAVNSVSAPGSAGGGGLVSLQEATESLKDLAPYIFPMAEGSLDRFQLLNGGYQVQPALATVDSILANHIGELVIAVKTLSASVSANVSAWADSFDEQYVLTAMEVLKLAGTFQQDLQTFEHKTKDRVGLLAERMVAHQSQQAEVQKALVASTNSNSKKASSSFSLPDSWSVVEIDSILTQLVCEGGDNDEKPEDAQGDVEHPAIAALHQLVADDTDAPRPLYPESQEALERLSSSCHAFVFDICSAVPRKHLEGVSEMVSWRKASSEDDLDSYGTLPQEYITQVGEHMLALVQALEPFAADQETLAIANLVMNGVKGVALSAWTDFVAAAGILGSESTLQVLMNGWELGHLVLNNAALTEEDAQLEEGTSEAEVASATFCNAWLDVVGLAVTGRLLERLMRIPQLTPKGCEHMSADLNYLTNIFSALGVAGHPHPLVSHLAQVASLPDDDLRSHIAGRDRSNEAESALRAIETRVALLRGISI